MRTIEEIHELQRLLAIPAVCLCEKSLGSIIAEAQIDVLKWVLNEPTPLDKFYTKSKAVIEKQNDTD